MNINPRFTVLLKFSILILVFILSVREPVDLDLGWHLRYGEYFFQTGQVLKDNILSFVWPDYKWVQASWGYDLLTYIVFKHFGFLGMSLAGAFFTTLIFLVITFPLKKFTIPQLFIIAVIYLSQAAPLFGSGMRTQTPSTLFFALTIAISYYSLFVSKTTKMYYLLPLLFLIWANMHGGFSLGLILIFIIWISLGAIMIIEWKKHVKVGLLSRKQWATFGLFLLLSVITPLFNPWGLRIYEETLKHSSNLNLSVITEWMPMNILSLEGIIALLFFAFTLLIAILRRKITDIPYIIILALVTYMAFSAVRFMIVFSVVMTYYLAQALPEVEKKIIKKPYTYLLSRIVPFALFILLFLDVFFVRFYFYLPQPGLTSFHWSHYCRVLLSGNSQAKDCSEEITEIMLRDPPKGNGFHPYNYGGYLTWRVPQVKTFLDGRMAAWEKNGKTPPVIDGDTVFIHGNPIPFRRFDSQYNFKWAIVPTDTFIKTYLDTLSDAGQWELKYSDEFYSYYVKN